MNSSRRVTGYDLFKLIVAIILFLLFLLLNRRTTPVTPSPVSTSHPNENASPVPASFTQIFQTATPPATRTGLPSSTLTEVATSTDQLTLAATTLPSPTPTSTVEPTETTQPSSTSTPPASITSTSEAKSVAVAACDSASSLSRLKVGGQAILLRRLNFRSSPGIQDNWLRTNLAGTKVEVIDGPECIPYVNGAYIWWRIKLPDGEIGWSAEASQFGSFYFMAPEE